jgi:membrane peptidoglycan carboxypeptidase
MFPNSGRTTPVHNSGGAACKPNPKSCTVKDAMTQSVNTVFYDMGLKVGTGAVAKAAYQAGIPTTVGGKPQLVGYDSNNQPDPNLPPDGNISIGGGNTTVRPVDMAYAYATFANNGTKYGTAPHFVAKVVNSQGTVVYQSQNQPTQAFDANPTKNADIARNVTESMTSVASGSYIPLAGGRAVAAKTGTEQSVADPNGNSNAWTVGYTPSVAAAAWVGSGSDMPAKGNYPCQACGGAGHDIYGRMEPGVMWQKFMDVYLNGTPHEQFAHLQLLNAPPPPPSTSQVPPSAQQNGTGPTATASQAPTDTTTTNPTTTHVTPTPGCSLLAPCDTGQPTPPTVTTSHGGKPTTPAPPGG